MCSLAPESHIRTNKSVTECLRPLGGFHGASQQAVVTERKAGEKFLITCVRMLTRLVSAEGKESAPELSSEIGRYGSL